MCSTNLSLATPILSFIYYWLFNFFIGLFVNFLIIKKITFCLKVFL